MVHRTKRIMNEANLRGQTWRQVRGFAGAVLRETRDLVIKWPQWHTVVLEGQVNVDMRYFCPNDVKKMLLKQARSTFWK